MPDSRPPEYADGGDEMLDTGAGPPNTRRWVVALVVAAAAVIALLVVRVSTNSPAAGPSRTSPSATPPVVPIIPYFPAPRTSAASLPVPTSAPFRVCPSAVHCSRTPTTTHARAAIDAAFVAALGEVTDLHITTWSVPAAGTLTGRGLVSRLVTADFPGGRIKVLVTGAPNPEGASVNLSGPGMQLHMDHFEHGFYVKMTVAGDHLGSLTLMGRLRRLIGDVRLVSNK